MKESTSPNYWVVGAFKKGNTDLTETFTLRGYWSLGWDDTKESLVQTNRRDQMKVGDRIAIKKLIGDPKKIAIRAIGIVTDIDKNDDKRVYVDWLLTDLHREVESKGCYATIHGPFPENETWVKDVFHI